MRTTLVLLLTLALLAPTPAVAEEETATWTLVVDEGVSRGPEDNAAIAREVLAGAPGPRRDVVVLNAAAALVVAGRATSLRDGAEQAAAAIDGGRVRALLDRLQKELA